MAQNISIIATECSEYFIGIVADTKPSKIIVINAYIPPTTSKYAPSTAEGYKKILESIQRWVWTAQLQYGSIDNVVWIGNFNARLGDLAGHNSPDKI